MCFLSLAHCLFIFMVTCLLVAVASCHSASQERVRLCVGILRKGGRLVSSTVAMEHMDVFAIVKLENHVQPSQVWVHTGAWTTYQCLWCQRRLSFLQRVITSCPRFQSQRWGPLSPSLGLARILGDLTLHTSYTDNLSAELSAIALSSCVQHLCHGQ